MTKKIAVNLISGQLGSGKTTLIRHLISQKPQQETWALLVNEFGAIGIDGAILEKNAHLQIKQLAGGCICCTAQDDLYQAILAFTGNTQIDRLLIEPTGLSEPDTLVDIFLAPELKQHFRLESLMSVFDVSNTEVMQLKNMAILQSLLTMSDIIILNKSDLATTSQIENIKQFCDQLYPPKTAVLVSQNAQIPLKLIEHSHFQHSAFKPEKTSGHTGLSSQTSMPLKSTLPFSPSKLPNLIERAYQQQLETQSIGWVFNSDTTFNWTKLQSLFESLMTSTFFSDHHKGVLRAKGIFKVAETSRMLFQLSLSGTSRELIAYRKDSRLEVLISNTSSFQFESFETALKHCIEL